MSCKKPPLNLGNSFAKGPQHCEGAPPIWGKTPSTDGNVKLAGEEAKDRLYEPKHKKKAVRVLTVVAYVFFVSLAAIMLSLYYVFIWHGHSQDPHRLRPKCDRAILQMKMPPGQTLFENVDATVPSTTVSSAEDDDDDDSTWPSLDYPTYNNDIIKFSKRSVLIRKLSDMFRT